MFICPEVTKNAESLALQNAETNEGIVNRRQRATAFFVAR
jgi:hypothetical protein